MRRCGAGPQAASGGRAAPALRPMLRDRLRRLGALLVAGLAAACVQPAAEAPGAAAADARAPETASGWQPKTGRHFRRAAVAAAHPLAAAAGLEILRAGGNAVDAAVAVQMVLGVVEPQSSGIGGGALMLVWDGRRVHAWDGRETAPAAADETLFLGPDGRPLPYAQAAVGGRAVGVPGAVPMLEAAQRRHGRLPWARLFAPAILLAEDGFAIGARLHAQLEADAALRRDPLARALYYDAGGRALAAGTRLRNPALAAILRRLAAEGSGALLRGAVAADFVQRVRSHPTNPGRLALADLAGYREREREPLCADWRSSYRICGFPPPSSGQLALMQILALLDDALAAQRVAERDAAGLPSADWLHLYSEAAALAFADRDRYVADPDRVAAPAGDWLALLDPGYLRKRAALIGTRAIGTAPPGTPPGAVPGGASMPAQPEHGTSHVSIVDADGNAVALTTTIEAGFGARLMADGGTGLAGGVLLNSELTDFSFVPRDAQGRPVANRVEPGKRPRSSMSPTFVFDRGDGRLLMVLGSPGGAAIIHFVAKTLVGTLAWGLDPQRAVELPNVADFNGPTFVEAGRLPPATLAALAARGHEVRELPLASGVHALVRVPDGGWLGGADPRREGVVVGE